MTDEADRVARGLTEAQRAAMLWSAQADYYGSHEVWSPDPSVMLELRSLGLVGGHPFWNDQMNQFGLLVRDKLKGPSHD